MLAQIPPTVRSHCRPWRPSAGPVDRHTSRYRRQRPVRWIWTPAVVQAFGRRARCGAPVNSNQHRPDGDTRRTPEVSGVGFRLQPTSVARPPVDPASPRAFARPPGSARPSPGAENYPDQHRAGPREIVPEPVLVEAFGHPYAGAESLQRQAVRTGRWHGTRNGDTGNRVDDDWRDPDAIAALGAPALQEPPCASVSPDTRQAGCAGRAVRPQGLLRRAGRLGDRRVADRLHRGSGRP